MSIKQVLKLVRQVIEQAELVEIYLEDGATATAADRMDSLEEHVAYLRKELDAQVAKEDLSGSVVFLGDPQYLPALEKHRVDLSMDGHVFRFVDVDPCKATQLAVTFAEQHKMIVQVKDSDLDN